MTATTYRLIGFAFGLAVSVYAQRTDAGFISVVLEDELVSIASVDSVHASRASDEAPQNDPPVAKPPTDLGIFALPANAPTTSMGSGASSSTPVATAFALADSHDCSSGQIVTYLTAHPGVQAPVPFLDGIFRPPKAVVSL